MIRELSDQGTTLLLITSDMPEMITMADRIMVMSDYRMLGGFDNSRDCDEVSKRIMGLILGGMLRTRMLAA